MWNLIEFQCGNIRVQEQPHISYIILLLHGTAITLNQKSMGSTKIKL